MRMSAARGQSQRHGQVRGRGMSVRTEVSDWNDVHDAPNEISGLPLQFEAERSPGPAASTITANDILGMDNLTRPGSSFALRDQLVLVIFTSQVAPEQTISNFACASLLLRGCLFFGEMTQLECYREGSVVLDLGLVDLKGLGKDSSLDFDGVLGVLLDVVQEEALNTALVQDDLLEPGQANDSVGDAIRTMDDTVRVGIPHADLNHVVCLLPRPIGKPKTVEDLKTAALQAVCLTAEDLGVSLVDDPCLHAAVRHPGRCHQPVPSMLVRDPGKRTCKDGGCLTQLDQRQ